MNILIIGAGDIGFHLTKRLSFEKHNITVIESDPKKVSRAHDQLDARIIEGSGTSYNSLKEANLFNTDVFAALTNNDEVNLMACRIAKKAGVKTTVARVRNPEYGGENPILTTEEMGVDFLITPEKFTAKAIVRLIRQSSATDVIEFDEGRIKLFGIRLEANCPVIHTSLKDLAMGEAYPDMRIVAIKRRENTVVPRGDDILLKGDQIFIICDNETLPNALKYFGKADTKVERILIIGGGLVGQYIAQELEKDISCKIIEQDKKKSSHLAGVLSNTLVIHGDGSDLDLLVYENLTEMDEFIAVTGDDETNIITSLVARHLEVPRAITLLRKPEYLPLTPAIGMDSVVSKYQITVNAIQKYIRGQQIAFFAELPGVDAEIIEFIAKPKSKIVKKPLKDINFPQNAIVGAVMKDNAKSLIPGGLTHIQPGDRVVVFSLPSEIKNVEKLFG